MESEPRGVSALGGVEDEAPNRNFRGEGGLLRHTVDEGIPSGNFRILKKGRKRRPPLKGTKASVILNIF